MTRPDALAFIDGLQFDDLPAAVVRQAERCLRCDVQTWFEGPRCIACNGCVDVCPDDCLHLVGLSQVASDPRLLTLAKSEFRTKSGPTATEWWLYLCMAAAAPQRLHRRLGQMLDITRHYLSSRGDPDPTEADGVTVDP